MPILGKTLKSDIKKKKKTVLPFDSSLQSV